MLIVKKFGGTSVANKERIFNVARRCIEDYKAGHDVVVVLSAMGDTTDELIELANQFQLSQSYFWSKNTKLPIQLSEIYTQLKPSNRRKIILKSSESIPQPKSKLSVQKKWLKLLRKMKTQPPAL